ncbi:MAG: TetR/AcrR family transcriptional regulator [Chloroflexi bacterium]|nr:MAG: TetR/AcrR family transcriptional regulator [Chloroflexota bacterium]
MARGVRERMVASAVDLLARHGLQATSFSEVLDHSGAPRGSIYHHFPEGKEQMIGSALDLAGGRAIELLDRKAGARAEEVATWFLHIWREVLIRGKFEAGCAVLAVAVAAESPELLDQTARVFRTWRQRLAELLEQGGLQPGDAQRFAATLVASSEGAVVLARAEQSLEPFELVAEQLLDQVRALNLRGNPRPSEAGPSNVLLG